MKKITISFKNTTKDIKLLNCIKEQEEKSQFIKDAIEYYIKKFENEGNNNGK